MPAKSAAQLSSIHPQTYTILRDRLKALAATQFVFAGIFDVHPNTVSNWVRGITRMNAAAELLLDISIEDVVTAISPFTARSNHRRKAPRCGC